MHAKRLLTMVLALPTIAAGCASTRGDRTVVEAPIGNERTAVATANTAPAKPRRGLFGIFGRRREEPAPRALAAATPNPSIAPMAGTGPVVAMPAGAGAAVDGGVGATFVNAGPAAPGMVAAPVAGAVPPPGAEAMIVQHAQFMTPTTGSTFTPAGPIGVAAVVPATPGSVGVAPPPANVVVASPAAPTAPMMVAAQNSVFLSGAAIDGMRLQPRFPALPVIGPGQALAPAARPLAPITSQPPTSAPANRPAPPPPPVEKELTMPPPKTSANPPAPPANTAAAPARPVARPASVAAPPAPLLTEDAEPADIQAPIRLGATPPVAAPPAVAIPKPPAPPAANLVGGPNASDDGPLSPPAPPKIPGTVNLPNNAAN